MNNNKIKAAGWHHAASKNILKSNFTNLNKHSQIAQFNNLLTEDLPCPKIYYIQQLNKITSTGASGWALAKCPFHDDKNPSLTVNLIHGGFKCFSCGAVGANIVHFHLKKYSLTFKDALNELKELKASSK